MVLPIPNLDDRNFDTLVKEARERLATHLPELTQIAPGDPAHAMIDVFAYLTETMLFRMNLIPERQRRAVMNLLQIPQRHARPAHGVVCVDAGPRHVSLPPLLREGAQLKAGKQQFTTIGELQATALSLSLSIKRALSNDELYQLGFDRQALAEQYGLRGSVQAEPFEPQQLLPGQQTLSLAPSLDKAFYLAMVLPKTLRSHRQSVLENLAGTLLNIAIAPADDSEAEEISALPPRKLEWDLLTQDEAGNILALPLEIIADSSLGGRQSGIIRLRLLDNVALYQTLAVDDPMFAGVGDYPPELPVAISADRVAFWLRLRAPDEPELALGYLGVNGVEVSGLAVRSDTIIGSGTGNPDQIIKLPDSDITPDSLVLQVEEDNAWVAWQRVDFLLDLGARAKAYRLDPLAGVIYFGDGLEGGMRPAKGRRIRVARYMYGGGSSGNIGAGNINELLDNSGRLLVRHEWPTSGGLDAEAITQAEKRIPQYLSHRNRAVTEADFKVLCQNNPVNPVAKAEVLPGFLPGAHINAARQSVPGVVSLFVMPPRLPALREAPKPSRGLLKDVYRYLSERSLIGTELYVLSPEFVPLAVGVVIYVLDPQTQQETEQAVQTALIHYLWALPPGGARGEGWNMGTSVKASELATQVARVPGVRAVDGLELFAKDGSNNTSTNTNTNNSANNSRWRRLPDEQDLLLSPYQMPQLMGVSVLSLSDDVQGGRSAGLPRGLEAEENASNGIPAPVIPDVC